MDYLSPPSNKLVDSIRFSEEKRLNTPINKRPPSGYNHSPSPDFSPFNYSSPMKSDQRMNSYRGRNKRYFNKSDSSFNSSGNFSSPYNKHRRFSGNQNYRGGQNNSRNYEAPISAYIDSSVTEDPWYELEKELQWDDSCQSSSDSSQPNPSPYSPT